MEEGVKWKFFGFGGICIGIFFGYALAYNSEILCADSTDKFGLTKSADWPHVPCSRIGGAPKYPSEAKMVIVQKGLNKVRLMSETSVNGGG